MAVLMAKARPRLNQPTGGVVSVGPEERAWFKKQREAKKLGQAELGKKVGASQGTISNLESGKHPQINKSVYDGLIRVLGRADSIPNIQDVQREIAHEMADAPESALVAARELLRALKTKR